MDPEQLNFHLRIHMCLMLSSQTGRSDPSLFIFSLKPVFGLLFLSILVSLHLPIFPQLLPFPSTLHFAVIPVISGSTLSVAG